jgi:ATP-binding cassette, subfamily F, member 3
VLISHDRHLIEACADRLWLVAERTVTPFDGDLDDYGRLVLSNRRDTGRRDGGAKDEAASRPSRQEIRRAAAEKRAELAPLQQRIKRAETAITRWTKELARLDAALAAPDLYADPAKASGLAKDRADAARALAAAETDWLTASAEYEEAMALDG